MEKQIKNNYRSHDVSKSQGDVMLLLRSACMDLAFEINGMVPNGREKSIALTKLEEVMFWANAGIARK